MVSVYLSCQYSFAQQNILKNLPMQVVACFDSSLLMSRPSYDGLQLLPSLLNRPPGCFQFLALINKVARTILGHIFLCVIQVFISWANTSEWNC